MPPDELARALYAAYAAEVADRRGTMEADGPTMDHIREAARWLADPAAKPGLMLQGSYGNGKTTLMNAICRLVNYLFYSSNSNERIAIRRADAHEVARLAARDETRPALRKLIDEELLAIDDLGEEPAEVLCYGMVHTPVKDLLLHRYRTCRFTIASTNLINTPQEPQIARQYDGRVVDRMREMFHFITFTNPSYRRQQA